MKYGMGADVERPIGKSNAVGTKWRADNYIRPIGLLEVLPVYPLLVPN